MGEGRRPMALGTQGLRERQWPMETCAPHSTEDHGAPVWHVNITWGEACVWVFTRASTGAHRVCRWTGVSWAGRSRCPTSSTGGGATGPSSSTRKQEGRGRGWGADSRGQGWWDQERVRMLREKASLTEKMVHSVLQIGT